MAPTRPPSARWALISALLLSSAAVSSARGGGDEPPPTTTAAISETTDEAATTAAPVPELISETNGTAATNGGDEGTGPTSLGTTGFPPVGETGTTADGATGATTDGATGATTGVSTETNGDETTGAADETTGATDVPETTADAPTTAEPEDPFVTTTTTTTTSFTCDLCGGRGGTETVLEEKRDLTFLPTFETAGAMLGADSCDKFVTGVDTFMQLLADENIAVSMLGLPEPMPFEVSCPAFQKLGVLCGCEPADPPCGVCPPGETLLNPEAEVMDTTLELLTQYRPTCGWFNEMFLANSQEGTEECATYRMEAKDCQCGAAAATTPPATTTTATTPGTTTAATTTTEAPGGEVAAASPAASVSIAGRAFSLVGAAAAVLLSVM